MLVLSCCGCCVHDVPKAKNVDTKIQGKEIQPNDETYIGILVKSNNNNGREIRTSKVPMKITYMIAYEKLTTGSQFEVTDVYGKVAQKATFLSRPLLLRGIPVSLESRIFLSGFFTENRVLARHQNGLGNHD
jgi:hypothetical protein